MNERFRAMSATAVADGAGTVGGAAGAATAIQEEGPREISRVDFIFLIDSTGSMGTAVRSLAHTMKQLFSIIRLLFPGNKARIAVVAYTDHNLGPRLVQMAGFECMEEDLLRFVDKLKPTGNLDTPEAAKSGLHEVLRLIDDSIRKDGDTSQSVVIHYTDTCPHHEQSPSHRDNRRDSIRRLDGVTPGYDWMAICKYFRRRKIPVYTFLTSKGDQLAKLCYSFLGELVMVTNTSTFNITRGTVGLLMHLLGEEFAYDEEYTKAEVDRKEERLERIVDETIRGGFPEKRYGQFNLIPFRFEKLEGIAHLFDVEDLILRFREDEFFVDVVFNELGKMFTVDNVMALTYNPILGKLWRLCCRRRSDSRLQKLRDRLMQATERLDPINKSQLKDWLTESYNESEEITKVILDHPRQIPCLCYDSAAAATNQVGTEELRSIARNPTSAAMAVVQNYLAHLQRFDGRLRDLPQKGEVPLHLPLGLSDENLFSYLPHLLSPGMKFSLRPTMYMAALCVLTGNALLADRAAEFLTRRKGRWLYLDDVYNIPEVMAEESVKLLFRIKDFLTEREASVFDILHRVSRLRRASRMEYSGSFAVQPSVSYVWPDYKIKCVHCHYFRSFTLTVDGDVCGVCRSMRENPQAFGRYVPKPSSAPEEMSHMATCRTCGLIYEVITIKDLKVEPKCHNCRFGLRKAKFIQCVRCFNKYIDHCDLRKKLGISPTEPWTCFICQKTPGRAFETLEFNLFKAVSENPKLLVHFGFVPPATKVIFSSPIIKNLKLYTEQSNWIFVSTKISKNHFIDSKIIRVNGRICVNAEEVIKKIVEDVTSGDLAAPCFFCFEDKEVRFLQSACGKCRNRACADCLRSWYGNLQPGKLVLTTRLTCAFCKQIPTRSTIERYNPAAKALVRGEHLGKLIARLSPKLYYGWCKGCSKVAEIGDKSCGDDVMPFTENDNFICEACRLSAIGAPNVPKCPGCEAPTVKAYGCNHIECPVCRTHWCYVCRQEFKRENIYDHLIQVHGSIGLEDIVIEEGAVGGREVANEGVADVGAEAILIDAIDPALVEEDRRAREMIILQQNFMDEDLQARALMGLNFRE